MKAVILKNIELIKYIGLSYFDKAVIFLIPFAVLFFFDDQSVYIQLEYIFSIGLIAVPIIAIGLPAYFFIEYRNSKLKRSALVKMIRTFHLWFLVIALFGAFCFLMNFFLFPFEENLFLIIVRVLFVVVFSFLASLFRLTDKPRKALYITLISNVITLATILVLKVSELEFQLWHAFLGQIIFIFFYLIYVLLKVVKRLKIYLLLPSRKVIYDSLVFAWPSIIQVFILLYIGNYGKINAIGNMSLNEGTLFALLIRLSLIIQLSHSSIIAFSAKGVYTAKGIKDISSSLLYKYSVFILVPILLVALSSLGYYLYVKDVYEFELFLFVGSSIMGYTVLWCYYSYFEMYYTRENKNIIKLYLSGVNAVVFIVLMQLLSMDFIRKVSFSMFISILVSLVVSIIVLRRRKYSLS